MAEIKNRLIAMTPHAVFKLQVQGVYDNLRNEGGKDYIPPQLGGPHGQREVLDADVVLSVADFKG